MKTSLLLEHAESTAEEITNHFGLQCKVIRKTLGYYISVDSFIGTYEYKCILFGHGYMTEFYRFCYAYGAKLSSYGLTNKIKR